MRRLTKPCPGCNTTDHRRSRTYEVCDECKRLLSFAKEELKRRNEALKEDIEIVQAPERAYALGGYYSRGVKTEVSDEVKTAMHALIMSVAGPVDSVEGRKIPWGTKHRIVPSNKATDWLRWYRMKKDTVDAILNLDAAIHRLQDAAEKGAYEEGHNLLLGLASGEKSVRDFNEEAKGVMR